MELRKLKDLQSDMRDDRDIYPKRGISNEECAVIILMDLVHYFNSIKQDIKMCIPWDNKDSRDKLNFFEERMHEKFDVVESLLKECNIEQWENIYNEQNKKLEKED